MDLAPELAVSSICNFVSSSASPLAVCQAEEKNPATEKGLSIELHAVSWVSLPQKGN